MRKRTKRKSSRTARMALFFLILAILFVAAIWLLGELIKVGSSFTMPHDTIESRLDGAND